MSKIFYILYQSSNSERKLDYQKSQIHKMYFENKVFSMETSPFLYRLLAIILRKKQKKGLIIYYIPISEK